MTGDTAHGHNRYFASFHVCTLHAYIYIFSAPHYRSFSKIHSKKILYRFILKKKNPSISFSVYGNEDKTFSLSNLLSARSGDSSLSVSHVFNDLFGRRENAWKKRKGNLMLGKFKFSFLFSVLFSKWGVGGFWLFWCELRAGS